MHPWDLTAAEAIALQLQLAAQVQRTNGFVPDQLRTVAGVDVSYTDISRAAVVLLSYPDLQLLDQATAVRATAFPYIPGLLSFRELPAALDALAKLRVPPDLLIADGQGIAHPRRFGVASHLGVLTGIPTIGCAKSRLTGRYVDPGPLPGDASPLLAGQDEVIGTVVRSKLRTRPLFISIGHKIDLTTALSLVLRCLRGYRLPEPTRLADKLSKVHYPDPGQHVPP